MQSTPARPQPRELTLLRKQLITPHMLRLTLGGEGMAHFPQDQASAYVKLIFPRNDQPRPIMRTYTVRAQRDQEIDIDFVLHEDAGPASSWASTATPGSRILVGGPGPKKLTDPEAHWVLLIGDMTALPAISVNLELLPPLSRGHAIIEVHSSDDIQPLSAPSGIQIDWLINPHPGTDESLLLERVKQLSLPNTGLSVWCACELNSMRRLRAHLREHPALGRDNFYISSYWKLGADEETHKTLKKQDLAE